MVARPILILLLLGVLPIESAASDAAAAPEFVVVTRHGFVLDWSGDPRSEPVSVSRLERLTDRIVRIGPGKIIATNGGRIWLLSPTGEGTQVDRLSQGPMIRFLVVGSDGQIGVMHDSAAQGLKWLRVGEHGEPEEDIAKFERYLLSSAAERFSEQEAVVAALAALGVEKTAERALQAKSVYLHTVLESVIVGSFSPPAPKPFQDVIYVVDRETGSWHFIDGLLAVSNNHIRVFRDIIVVTEMRFIPAPRSVAPQGGGGTMEPTGRLIIYSTADRRSRELHLGEAATIDVWDYASGKILARRDDSIVVVDVPTGRIQALDFGAAIRPEEVHWMGFAK